MDEDKGYLESILKIALSFDSGIQEIVDESKKIKDDTLREKMLAAVGLVVKHLTLGIIFPITKLYPDLDNEKWDKDDDPLLTAELLQARLRKDVT